MGMERPISRSTIPTWAPGGLFLLQQAPPMESVSEEEQPISLSGDYDGDGKADVAIYRGSNGGWYIIPSLPPEVPYGVGWGGDSTDISVMR